MAIFKLVLLDKKDLQAVLPTGFGSSLIYQTFAPFTDFLTVRNQLNVVIQFSHCISPLNALIKETGLRAYILKADRVAWDCQDIEEVSVSSSEQLKNLTNFHLLYAHPEALVESKQVLKLLKRKEFQNRIRAIVVGEEHLVVDWYVHVLLKCITFTVITGVSLRIAVAGESCKVTEEYFERAKKFLGKSLKTSLLILRFKPC